MASKFKQDMPPEGGYSSIEWAKKAAKRGLGGYKTFALFGAVTAFGWACYYADRAYIRKWRLEERDAEIALQPLMQAERERMFLRQLRANRDEEAELMKDVPGWEVGKWKGEPVYWNQSNRYPVVHMEEYYMHNNWKHYYRRLHEKIYH